MDSSKIMVVFDFDRTLIDDDSDRWIITKMGLNQMFQQFRLTMPWNSLMDRLLEELHSSGKTIDDIVECLQQIPLHPRTAAAIRSAHALGCDLKVLSDANQFYIETILKHHELYDCFSEIITNPTFMDKGRLRIIPFHDPTSLHGCNLCPPNLCKGIVIKHRKALTLGDKKVQYIYLGDGKGDFCPTLQLDERDYIMPRKGFALCDLVLKNPSLVNAQVHEWSTGEELERILLQLINDNSNKS